MDSPTKGQEGENIMKLWIASDYTHGAWYDVDEVKPMAHGRAEAGEILNYSPPIWQGAFPMPSGLIPGGLFYARFRHTL